MSKTINPKDNHANQQNPNNPAHDQAQGNKGKQQNPIPNDANTTPKKTN